MKRTLSAAAVISVFAAFGCSPAMQEPKAASSAASASSSEAATQDVKAKSTDADEAKISADAADEAASDETAKADSSAETAAPVAPWSAGDFVVYRFSGSFHKTPATLTEKVVARQGDTFTLDVTYDDGKTKDSIRAKMKGDSPAHADVISVARLSHGAEQPASVALYEQILARVALVADQNEARLGSEALKLDVAGHGTVACERATFRVKVGNETATMRTIESAAFAWGDLGAEITTAGGKLIYKAEIVDAGHETAKPAVASADDDY